MAGIFASECRHQKRPFPSTDCQCWTGLDPRQTAYSLYCRMNLHQPFVQRVLFQKLSRAIFGRFVIGGRPLRARGRVVFLNGQKGKPILRRLIQVLGDRAFVSIIGALYEKRRTSRGLNDDCQRGGLVWMGEVIRNRITIGIDGFKTLVGQSGYNLGSGAESA